MTEVSTLGQALDQISRLKTLQGQLADYQGQIASGKKTQLFKGMGVDVLISKRARADVNHIAAYNNNIDIAQTRIRQMLTSVEEFQTQARNVLDGLTGQPQQGQVDVESIKTLAVNVFNYMTDILNAKDGDRYLFSGADSANKPVSNNGILQTYIQTQISDWQASTIDTDTLITSYRDTTILPDTSVGYSAVLSSGTAKDITVRVSDTSEVDYTLLANHEGFRNILVAVQTVANLPDDVQTAPGADSDAKKDNYFQMFNDLAEMITTAVDDLDQERYKLEQARAELTRRQDQFKLDRNTLLKTIGSVEDADMTEVAAKVNILQIQLEASFRVTATVSQLTLSNFLG